MAALASSFANAISDFDEAIKPVQDHLSSVPGDVTMRFPRLFKQVYEQITQNMETLVAKYRPPEVKGFFDTIFWKPKKTRFQEAIDEACDAIAEAAPIPSPAELEGRFLKHGGWPAVVQLEQHHLRSQLTKDFATKLDEQLDQIVGNVLTELLNKLLSALPNRLLKASEPNEPCPRERIREFKAS